MQRVRTETFIFIERQTGIKNADDLMALKAPNVEDFETQSRRPGHRQSVTISIDIMGNLGMSYSRYKRA